MKNVEHVRGRIPSFGASLRGAAVLALLVAAGCAGDAPADGAERADDDAQALQVGDPTRDDANPLTPGGTTPTEPQAFFSRVTASGTGCPIGTWTSEVTDNGSRFAIFFDQYFARIEDGTRSVTRECNLQVRLTSPNGVQYSVSEFVYNGGVDLEEGVTATQTAQYYFQGMRADPDKQNRTELVGPKDNEQYSFTDTVTTTDVVWSPCGENRLLYVTTRLGLKKTQNIGEGTITLSSIDGLTKGKVIFKLSYRKCPLADAGVR